MIFVFLIYFTQDGNLQIHPCCFKLHYFIIFMAEQYTYVLYLLYLFHYWWTFRLFPCLGYCKQCFSELWGACIFQNYCFLQIYAQEQDCWIIQQFYFQFLKEHTQCSLQWLYQFTFPPTVQEGSQFSTPSPVFVAYRIFFFYVERIFIYFFLILFLNFT